MEGRELSPRAYRLITRLRVQDSRFGDLSAKSLWLYQPPDLPLITFARICHCWVPISPTSVSRAARCGILSASRSLSREIPPFCGCLIGTDCGTTHSLDSPVYRIYYTIFSMWSWFGGAAAEKRKDVPKNAILDLRSQLEMLQKREKHLEAQVAEQDAVARKHVNTNKNGKPPTTMPYRNHTATTLFPNTPRGVSSY